MQQAQDQQQVQQGNDLASAQIQPGMVQQVGYNSWARIKAARILDQLRGGDPRSFFTPVRADFDRVRQGGGSGGQQKLAAPQHSNPPTLPNVFPGNLLKAALISTGGKQPKVTATGDSGLPDEIKELPWSLYGSKAWPDKKDGYWRRVKAGSPGGNRDQSAGGWRTSPVAVRTKRSSGPGAAVR
jgi:hypothetical protein